MPDYNPDLDPRLGHTERFERLMAGELHDTVCQSLAGTSLLVHVLIRQVEAGKSVSEQDLKKIAVFLEEAMDDLRAIVSPDSLAGKGLAVALHKFSKSISVNLPCHVSIRPGVGVTDPRTALVLYRLARWSIRHAMRKADSIHVNMSSTDRRLEMEIRDGGGSIFGDLSEAQLGFLRHYAQTADIQVIRDTEGAWMLFTVATGS